MSAFSSVIGLACFVSLAILKATIITIVVLLFSKFDTVTAITIDADYAVFRQLDTVPVS